MHNSNEFFIGIICLFFLTSVTCTKDPVGLGPGPDTVTDCEGNVYQTVKIGSQVWMSENLRSTKYNDCSAIPLVTDNAAWYYRTTPGYCYYNNMTNADSIRKFGVLYNWYTIDTKKLAISGWHVPTDAEWDTLLNYMIAHKYNWDGTTTGNKIAKSLASSTDWVSDTTHGTIGNDLTLNNRSGFSALPGGSRLDYDGTFVGIGKYGYWWSAGDQWGAWYRGLCFAYVDLRNYGSNYKSCGFSVRLVRDN
jgi:uncharacterized protein (TIGR02145 family)